MTEYEIDSTEEDFLSIDGICTFPDDVVKKPSQIRIASPYIGVTDLIQSLVVVGKNGPEEIPYAPGVDKVIGFTKNEAMIECLQLMYGGRGILFASPENPTDMLTMDEWTAKYGTDPLTLVVMMRIWWNSTGGGVKVYKNR